MEFIKSTFINNFAEYGGTFFIEGNGYPKLQDVAIISSTATTAGGLVYGKGSALPSYPIWGSVEINITTTGTGQIPVTL